MKNKSKSIFILVSVLSFVGLAIGGQSAFAVNSTSSADAVVNVMPSCAFSSDTATTIFSLPIGVVVNTESISAKPDIETTCNNYNGWRIQAIGYSPDATHPTGYDGNTSMYSSGETIPTGITGPSSYWSMKISSASASTTASILNGYGNYSVVPATATDVVNYTGDGAASTITGTMRADYQVYASGGQAPGTYTGIVKYTLAVNP